MQIKSLLPIKVNQCSVTALALLPFEKNPDSIYRCFELQYLNSKESGKGYRIIAYRNDKYVDIYDDLSLIFNPDETFDVVEHGANKHVQVTMKNVHLEMKGNCEVLGFEFTDIENRKVSFYYEETTKRKLLPMNLPAPVGMGSKDPVFLPLFFMHDFDFMRRKAKVTCTIDGESVKVDDFPIPMHGQMRTFCRYSNDCEFITFGDTGYKQLETVELNDSLQYIEDNIVYQFKGENVLGSITTHFEHGDTVISFEPALNLNQSVEGSFTVRPIEKMGYIRGVFSTAVEEAHVKLHMIPQEGWNPVPTSLSAKLLMGKKSLFRCWFQKYEYLADLDLESKEIHAKWTNQNEK